MLTSLTTAAGAHRLLATAIQLGGTIPEGLGRPMAAYDALDRARHEAMTGSTFADMMDSDQPLTAESATSVFDRAIRESTRAQVVPHVMNLAEQAACLAFRKALLGKAGEELTESLRPAFDAAVTDLEHVMSLCPPGMTAATAIESGPEHVKAWQLGADVARRLHSFEQWAFMVGRDWGLVTRSPNATHPMSSWAALFLDPDGQPNLDAAAIGYGARDARTSHRAGPFAAMVLATGCRLHLNTPAEAQRLVDEHEERMVAALDAGSSDRYADVVA